MNLFWSYHLHSLPWHPTSVSGPRSYRQVTEHTKTEGIKCTFYPIFSHEKTQRCMSGIGEQLAPIANHPTIPRNAPIQTQTQNTSTKHKIQTQNTKHKAHNTNHQIQNIKYKHKTQTQKDKNKTQSTKHKTQTQNTNHKSQSTKHKSQNTKVRNNWKKSTVEFNCMEQSNNQLIVIKYNNQSGFWH